MAMGRVGKPASARELALAGALPSAEGGRGQRVRREAAMAAPPLVHHSTVAICFYGSPSFLHKNSWLRISSLPSLQAVSLQPTAVLSPGLLSKPHVPAPNPCPHQRTHVLGWGTQGFGMDHVHRSQSVLPAIDWSLYSPPIAPEAPLVSQLISLLVRGLPRMQEPLLSFSIPPPGAYIPSHFLSSSFSLLLSFILPGYMGIFRVFLGVRGPLLVFSQCSVRIVPFVDVFFF